MKEREIEEAVWDFAVERMAPKAGATSRRF
jgi:hypothetical protein